MSASRHEHPELGPPELIEVADRVFAYVQPDGTWYINNTGFVVGARVGDQRRRLLDRAADPCLPGRGSRRSPRPR